MNDLRQNPRAVSSYQRAAAGLFPVLALVLALGVSGCKSKPAAPPADDTSLTQSVQGKLSSDTSLNSEPIQASVQDGIATLNGTVSTDAARSLAANDAAQVPGIKTVVNNLVVQAPQTSAAVSTPPAPPVKTEKAPRHPKPSAVVAPPTPPPPPPAAPIERADATPAPAPPPPVHTAPPAPAFRNITLDTDTTLPIRMTQTLDSATTQQGDTFSGVIASDVIVDGLVVIPQGTPVNGRVTAVQEAAHFKGNSLLSIELTSLDKKGDHLPLTTDTFSKSGNGRGKNSAEKIGGGAAVGAILGGIFGGGKGAAIGAAAGGGAGAGVQAATRGQQVQIPSETLVRFHLANPITIRVSTNSQPHNEGDLQHHD